MRKIKKLEMKKFTVLTFVLFIVTFSQAQITKRVLVEKFTSAGCGNCPNGTAELTSITANAPNVIWISHHAGFITDPMLFPEIDTIADAFTPGAPMAAVDRVKFAGQSTVAVGVNQFQSRITSQLAEVAQASVGVTGNYDPPSRVANIEVRVNFPVAVTAQNEYRINLIMVEDSVVGSGSSYNQSNYFNNTAGHAFQGMGNPITNYAHRHVSRDVISTAWGTSGIVPSSPMAATDYVANYTYTIPAGYDETKIRFVAFVTDFNTSNPDERQVLNANQEDLMNFGMTTNTRDIVFVNQFSILPNPVQSMATVSLESTKNQSIDIEIVNIAGQIVERKNNVQLQEGDNFVQLSTSDLVNGLYFVTVRNGNRLMTKKNGCSAIE